MKNLFRILYAAALAFVLTAALTTHAQAQSHDHGGHGQKSETQHEGTHQGHEGMHQGHMQGHEGMHDAHHAEMQASAVVHPKMVDGVQVVEIEVKPMGYSAERIALKAGVPARLVFTRTGEGGCTHQVQIPAFGIEPTDLPVGEPVAVEFTPDEDGAFAFACGMDMAKGMLVVKG